MVSGSISIAMPEIMLWPLAPQAWAWPAAPDTSSPSTSHLQNLDTVPPTMERTKSELDGHNEGCPHRRAVVEGCEISGQPKCCSDAARAATAK
jgi:hypothetical protein